MSSMQTSEITIKLQKSNTTGEEIDYNFFFRLYRYYLSIFNDVVFEIPYVRLVDGLPLITSHRIDIRDISYNEIVSELFKLESGTDFIGWQIA